LRALSFIGEDRARLNRDIADFMIYPKMEGIGVMNVAKWREAIEAGKNAAVEVIPGIKEEIKRRSRRWYFSRRRRPGIARERVPAEPVQEPGS